MYPHGLGFRPERLGKPWGFRGIRPRGTTWTESGAAADQGCAAGPPTFGSTDQQVPRAAKGGLDVIGIMESQA